MKRLLVSLLVLSLVLWTASTALAAGFNDTKGTKYEGATNLLGTLGLLTGFPDGTFRPGDTITRAQFCAVAVRALGLDNAAEYAAGATIFPDVPPAHWAAGYINIAVDQGICKGFPDGTFRPEAPVTYVEALAMLVRVLGYEPALRGSWPTNYLVKSFELGLSSGVTFSAGAPATRGDVAMFVNNCLDIHLMEQVVVGDEVQYAVTGATLLDDRLGYEALSGWVEETGDVLGTDLDSDEAVIDGDTYSLGTGVDLTPFLGLEVSAWLDGDTVLLADQLTDSDDVYQDQITDVDGDEITLADLDEAYDLDPEAIVYWNFCHQDAGDVDGGWEGADVTVVLNEDDEIVTLLATQYDGSAVVSDIDVDDEEVYMVLGSATEKKFDLADYDVLKFVKDGAEIDLEDLNLWDVAHYAEFAVAGDDVLFLNVFDEKVSGKLSEVGADSDDNVLLTVGGKDYTVDEDGTCSSDDNSTFDVVDEDTIETFAGESVTVYLDKYGHARHVVADLEEEEAPATLGLVVYVSTGEPWYDWGPPGDEAYYVKLITPDGKVTRYEWDDDTYFVGLDALNDGAKVVDGDEKTGALATLNTELESGTVIEFSLADGGLLDTVTELHFDNPGWSLDEGDIDTDHNVIDVGGTKYKAIGGTVIFDENAGDEDVYAWDTFEDIDIADNKIAARMFRDGDSTINVLVVDGEGETVTFPGVADVGVILKRVVTADGTAYKILVEDESNQYGAADADIDSLAKDNWGTGGSVATDIDTGDLVSFGLDAAGEEFASIEELDASFDFDADGDLTDETFTYAYINEGGIDPDNLILNVRCDEDKDTYDADDFELVLTEDTVIYDVSGSTPELAEFGDLEEDQCIQVFDLEGDGLIDYVKIIE